MLKFLRDNGLSLTLLLLFGLSIGGHSITGFWRSNEQLRQHSQPAITFPDYITSAAFVESVFENWESEFLQMALYVWLTSFLYQRGSAESKDPDKPDVVDEDPRTHRSDNGAPYPIRAGGLILKVYEHSLCLALFALFALSFVMHLIGSAGENCREQSMHGEACTSLIAHAGSAMFWFESFQNWQSEFLSIGVVVVFSIFLREKGSPESKPVHAPHAATGR